MTTYAVPCAECADQWVPARGPRPILRPLCPGCLPFAPARATSAPRAAEDGPDRAEREPVLVRGIDREDVSWRRITDAPRDEMVGHLAPDVDTGLLGWSRRPAPSPRQADLETAKANAALPKWLPAGPPKETARALAAAHWPPEGVAFGRAANVLARRLGITYADAKHVLQQAQALTERTTAA